MTTTKRSKSTGGFTFTEVMGAILVLTVAVLGTSAYRYHSTLDVRTAEMKTTGARIGSLLCETWGGVSDPNAFDPVDHLGTDLAITSISSSGSTPSGHGELGTYRITVDEDDYIATLFWKDVSAGLRALSVTIVWDWDPQVNSMGSHPISKSFRLTTYVTN
ncbi:MAG: type IV pilus modification PilV family protein [Planctomycetota bacterium]